MTGDNYEQFQRRMFDSLDELEVLDRQRIVESFVELGRQNGIDVIAEILDKGTPVPEVFEAIAKNRSKKG